MSVISLPDRNESIREAVETVWDFIGEVEDVEMLRYERRKAKVHAVLDGYRDEEVLAEIKVRRASLAREITWLPAIENRGEGVFIQFRKEAVEEWVSRKDVIDRGMRLLAGYDAWKGEHTGSRKKFVEAGGLLPYVLFHSFSHLLLTAVSLECGYPASSIRERIYTIPNVGYGVLLYTGTSDAEGTLGGLIQVGRRIHEHILNALKMGELCSNDPVCAQHQPANPHERRFLHGAACHGCL
ncbi:MAG: Zn-binding domain-containing protein, partial [Planctomyces sp.]